jgi:putative transposase
METILSYKIELNPNKMQTEYFCKACGIARFTWNWGLAEWKRLHEEGLKTSGFGLKKEFNAIKKESFPWVYEVTKYACQQPFFNLQAAFQNFFAGRAQFPNFKKKGIHDGFYIGNDHFEVNGKKIRFPKLGWVRMRECLGFAGEIVCATVSRIADKWFVSISVKMEITPKTSESQTVIGVDLGVKNLATISNGEVVEGPKAYCRLQKKLRRLQQTLSRREKGSKNRGKVRRQIARLHYRIACIRQDALHKLTTKLVRESDVIVIEDLNVKGMMRNGKLAKAIGDMGFFEFRRQLNYKSVIAGVRILVADRWFPFSKRCSICGKKHQDLTLSDRIFNCPNCEISLDRDCNAARNLKAYPRLMASSSTVSSTGT